MVVYLSSDQKSTTIIRSIIKKIITSYRYFANIGLPIFKFVFSSYPAFKTFEGFCYTFGQHWDFYSLCQFVPRLATDRDICHDCLPFLNRSFLSRVYKITFGSQELPVYCHMGDFGCGDGGWTMVMKIDGSKVSQNLFVIKPLLTMVSSFHAKFSLVHVMFCFESFPLGIS